MTQGFAQTPFVVTLSGRRHVSHEQAGPGKPQNVLRVVAPAAAGLSAVPAATPVSAPKATSAPLPKNPRRDVVRASVSATRCRSGTVYSPSISGQSSGLLW